MTNKVISEIYSAPGIKMASERLLEAFSSHFLWAREFKHGSTKCTQTAHELEKFENY